MFWFNTILLSMAFNGKINEFVVNIGLVEGAEISVLYYII